jgi:hypothetical protein
MRSIVLFVWVVGCGSSAASGPAVSASGAPGVGGSDDGGGTGSGSSGAPSGGASSGAAGAPVLTIPSGTPVPSVSGKAAHVKGTWRNITPMLVDPTAAPCTDLRYDPSTPTTLYAFYGNAGGLWKSVDAGDNWYKISDLKSPNSLARILIDPKDPKRIYLTGSVMGETLGFYISTDGGDHFAEPPAFSAGVGVDWNQDVYSIAADPADFNHFLLTFHNGWPCCGDNAGVLESKDGGKSYIVHKPPPGMDHGQGLAILSNAAKGGNADTWLVGAGYNPGLFRTADAGKTWAKVSDVEEDHGGFDAHYSTQGFLYIGVSTGILRSTDNGVTWTNPTMGIPSSWWGNKPVISQPPSDSAPDRQVASRNVVRTRAMTDAWHSNAQVPGYELVIRSGGNASDSPGSSLCDDA